MSEVANILDTPLIPAMLNGLPVSDIQAELDRILKSRVFVHSHRIRRFLQFVVEECLFGRQHRLKEYLIGLEVFNRHDDFDPRVDSIVRVEARRLRTKIEEYYQKEGQENEIRIELRKGSYVPVFEQRSPGIHGGYSGYPQLARRQSISIARLAAADGDTCLVDGILQQLSHELLKGGHFKVLADGSGGFASSPDGVFGRVNGSVKPDYILEGRLENDGENRRVSLRLINVKDRAYVWSDSGDSAHIDHLAGSLNRAMTTSELRPEHGRAGTRSSPRESFDLYLQGRFQWRLAAPESFSQSAELFSQAIDSDPNYAAAWASLAEVSLLSALFGFTNPNESETDRGEISMGDAAERAIQLNPVLPEAHLALACVESLQGWNWVAGERNFQRALQLDGGDSMAHMAYGIQLACRGMLKAALVEAECALELDPASLPVNFVMGWMLSACRRYDEAIAQHTAVARLAPDFPLSYVGLGWANLGKGQYTDALAHFSHARNLLRGWPLLSGCVGHCYAKLNQKADALNELEQLTSGRESPRASRVSVAAIQAGLGQNAEALGNLENAAGLRDCSLPLQLLNPEFDGIRDEPRYNLLMETIGVRRARAAASVASQ